MKKKSSFLTFLCALVPGVGQMYLGLMKRGVSLLLAFSVITAVSGAFGMSFLVVLLPVIWCFSFFDTFKLRSLDPESLAALDYYLFIGNTNNRESILNLLRRKRFIVGIVCIVFGVYFLFENVFMYFAYRFIDYEVIYDIMHKIPAAIGGILVIALGIFLMLGGKKPKPIGKNPEQDDFIGYGGEGHE